jgi:ribonuclease HII
MMICGVDEAGRGPLAGPVVAAAVIFPDDFCEPSIRDSKQLSARQRTALAHFIRQQAVAWSVVAVGARRIDKLNILQATRLAMKLAVERVGHADLVLIDGNQPIDTTLPQTTVVKGDQLHVQISAASILAKTWRDQLMERIARRYPQYDFARHVGYPTPLHRSLLEQYGPCVVHRKTFGPVRLAQATFSCNPR